MMVYFYRIIFIFSIASRNSFIFICLSSCACDTWWLCVAGGPVDTVLWQHTTNVSMSWKLTVRIHTVVQNHYYLDSGQIKMKLSTVLINMINSFLSKLFFCIFYLFHEEEVAWVIIAFNWILVVVLMFHLLVTIIRHVMICCDTWVVT